MIEKLLVQLQGKKTYIIGVLLLLAGLLQGDQAMIFTALGFLGLRSAIGKTEKK